MSLSHRHFLRLLAASALALGTLASAPALAQSASTLRYGHLSFGSKVPLDEIGWGLHKGIIQAELKKIGIDKVEVAGGLIGPDLNDALNSGSLDVVTYGDNPAIVGRAVGTPSRVIDFSSVTRESIVFTRPDGPADIKALNGKKIATVIGSTMHRIVAAHLDSQGVRPAFVSGGNDLSLLKSGAVDAIATWPYSAEIQKLIEGGYKVVYNSADHPGQQWAIQTVTTERYLTAHPELAKTWRAARIAAVKDLLAHEKEFQAWYATHTGLPQDQVVKVFPLGVVARGTPAEFDQGVALLTAAKSTLLKSARISRDFPINDWIVK